MINSNREKIDELLKRIENVISKEEDELGLILLEDRLFANKEYANDTEELLAKKISDVSFDDKYVVNDLLLLH